jgi:SNF2-related domain
MQISAKDISLFIPSYPYVNSPELIYKLTSKKELYDYRLEQVEDLPEKSGDLLSNQVIMKRIFSPYTPYNRALIFHGMGVGKCVHPSTKILLSTKNKEIDISLSAETIWSSYQDESSLKRDEDGGEWVTLSDALKVYSYVGDSFHEFPVKHLYRQFIAEELVKITLNNGYSIIITKAHHLFDGQKWTNEFDVGMSIMVRGPGDNPYKSSIESIEFMDYKGYVYDFEVDTYHNYVANGVVCHNTCTTSAIVETFAENEDNFRPALILVQNDTLKRNYTREISEVCTKNKYVPKLTSKELKEGVDMSEEAKVRRLNELIAKNYEIDTYQTFLNRMDKLSKKQIKAMYGGRSIFIDESHNFKYSKKKNKRSMYDQLKSFLEILDGEGRVYLLSGTPIVDKTSEFASQLNLLLPKDEQLPTGKAFDKMFFEDGKLKNIDILKEAMRGRVSYLRPTMTTAKRIEEGTVHPWMNNIKVYPDGMSAFQSKYARKARETEVKQKIKKKGERSVEGGVIYNTATNAATFVFPVFDEKGKVIGGEFGQEAFTKNCVIKKKTSKTIHNKETRRDQTEVTETTVYGLKNDFLRKEIKDNLYKYSAKFASVINEILSHPDEVIFVYMDAVTGSGAILLGLCLEVMGLKQVKSAAAIAHPSEQKRFAIVSTDPQTIHNDIDILKFFASASKPDNYHAERVQVIIGGPKVAEGVSLKSARQIHLIASPWNMPSVEQPLYRVIRFGSLAGLPSEEQHIKIYIHVAVETAKKDEGYAFGKGYPKDVAFSDNETIDIYIYRSAESKDLKNSQIYRVVKESSLDCALNYRRNVLPTDIDGSRDCNFEDCNYKCDEFPLSASRKSGKIWDYSVKNIDRSTYDLLYSQPRVKEIKDSIVSLFKNHFALHIDKAMTLIDLAEDEKILFLMAVDSIINSKKPIHNRYNFICYLKENGNIIFLDNNISSLSSYAENTYVANPLITDYSSMSDIIYLMESKEDKETIKEFVEDPSKESFENLSFQTRIDIFESLYEKQKLNKQEKKIKKIVDKYFGHKVYIVDGIPVHILYTEEYKGTSYDVAAKNIKALGKTRYFVEDESGPKWKYITDKDEEEKFIEGIKKSMSKVKEVGFEGNKYGVYGYIASKDGLLRISTGHRGRVCKTIHRDKLVDIIINKIGELPKVSLKGKNTEDLLSAIDKKIGSIKIDLTDRSDEDLGGILEILTKKREDLCEYLQNWLIKNNLMQYQ